MASFMVQVLGIKRTSKCCTTNLVFNVSTVLYILYINTLNIN